MTPWTRNSGCGISIGCQHAKDRDLGPVDELATPRPMTKRIAELLPTVDVLVLNRLGGLTGQWRFIDPRLRSRRCGTSSLVSGDGRIFLQSGRGPGATFAIHWSRRHRFGSVPLVSVFALRRAQETYPRAPRGRRGAVLIGSPGPKRCRRPGPPDGRTAVPPGRYDLGEQSTTGTSERIGKSR